jgi:hypothetical protein
MDKVLPHTERDPQHASFERGMLTRIEKAVLALAAAAESEARDRSELRMRMEALEAQVASLTERPAAT